MCIRDRTYFAQTGQYENRSQAIRLQFWSAAIDQASQSPLKLVFGNGVGGYAEQYRRLVGQAVPEPSGQPHNEYLAILSQGGLIGLALFLGLLVSAFRAAAQTPGLWILVLLLAVDALFNSVVWNMEEGHWALFLLASLAAGQIQSSLSNQHRLQGST